MNKVFNVTFDTNIFDSNQFDLSDGSSFSKLQKYSADGKINVYLSNIVLGEMKAHCSEYANKICSKIRKTKDSILKGELETSNNGKHSHRVSEAFLKGIQLSNILDIPSKEDVDELAISYLNNFIDSLKISLLDSKKVNIDDIFSSYFSKRPPFEVSEKKKYEFPDAVIAAQIKAKFSSKKPVYVVTADKGLLSALKDCSYCNILTSLGELFDLISKSEEEYGEVRNAIEKLLPTITNRIENELDDENISLEGIQFNADGSASGYDYDEVYFSPQNLNTSIFTIDYFDEKIISTRIRCSATIVADCTFNDYENAVWDSEEKEYIFLDTINITEVHEANFACSVQINRDDNSIDFIKFHVFLGGDSLLGRENNSVSSKEYNICPDCGKKICFENDAGNGFCINCVPNH